MALSFHRRQLIGGITAAGGLVALRSSQAGGAQVTAQTPKAVKAQVEWPVWDQAEEQGLANVLNSGRWGRTGGGKAVPEFETAFARTMQAKYCVATASGTTALLTTLGALGIGPGDEVILPPYTFVATFNAITNSFALPVFVDSDLRTFQIDASKVAAAITSSTRLLLPVHIGGSPVDMDAMMEIGKEHQIPVVEDACQALLTQWRGRPIGSLGLAGCFSFQASKNMTAGEGGAVLTNDESFAGLCYNFHTPGGGKPGPSLGRGSNYRLTEFQASLLLAQLTRVEQQSSIRDKNAAYLIEKLGQIPGITPAGLTDGCTRCGWHLFIFRYDSAQFSGLSRQAFLGELSRQGIAASGGYSSLNRSPHVLALAKNPHYLRLYGKRGMEQWLERSQCPVNDELCQQAVWFTQTTMLKSAVEMERIVTVIADVQRNSGDLARRS